ncbi:MAG TPA: OPT family oligopeptide transporter [bacterium]|nr:OPT family oligopeptide transporter [bacterium]
MDEQKTGVVVDPHEEADRLWLENVYQGDVKQLTFRAILMGIIIGGFMSLTNLYIGLKTGWGLGVTITACVLSFSIWKVLRKLFPWFVKTDMTLLENNSMKSTASSAGYTTGGTMVSAIAAYILITGHHLNFWVLTGWTIFLGIAGVVMAIPMKKQMINIEKLPFPSGTATAETLKSLYAGEESRKQTNSLLGFAMIGVVLTVVRDKFEWIKYTYAVFGEKLAQYTVSMETSLIMVAAGAIMGWRTAWSIMFGGILNYLVLAPVMFDIGAITELGYRGINSWSLWFGASVMVSAGFTSFFMQWKVAMKAFSGLKTIFSREKRELTAIEKVEVPMSWFFWGIVGGGTGIAFIMKYSFGISVWISVLAIILSFFLAIVACRATGETDTTPVGALGQVTQAFYGMISPGSMVTTLMTASVTSGIAGSSADLLTDLKTGYLLGANSRKMFLAQFIGIFAGTAIVVPAFYLIVPTPDVLGSDFFPAPAAQVWAGVAKLLAQGIGSLHYTAKIAMLAGLAVGIIIPLIEKFFPKATKYVPSSMGIGLAFVIPFWNCLSMFIGALIVLIIEKKRAALSEYVIPAASGIIAGESLAGVFIILVSTIMGK